MINDLWRNIKFSMLGIFIDQRPRMQNQTFSKSKNQSKFKVGGLKFAGPSKVPV